MWVCGYEPINGSCSGRRAGMGNDDEEAGLAAGRRHRLPGAHTPEGGWGETRARDSPMSQIKIRSIIPRSCCDAAHVSE